MKLVLIIYTVVLFVYVLVQAVIITGILYTASAATHGISAYMVLSEGTVPTSHSWVRTRGVWIIISSSRRSNLCSILSTPWRL
jgi:hypothetical protein